MYQIYTNIYLVKRNTFLKLRNNVWLHKKRLNVYKKTSKYAIIKMFYLYKKN